MCVVCGIGGEWISHTFPRVTVSARVRARLAADQPVSGP
jgi:hypothetical protein